jgi:hypothetical protein
METPRTHKDLIIALGGPSNLARKLGIYRAIPTTVHWSTRGIPSRYWHRITKIATETGLTITADDLERMSASAEAEAVV